MRALWLSDVHLLDPNSLKTQVVIRFLQEEASQYDTLYLLGDIFDVWPGTTPYLVETFKPVLEALRQLVKGGRRVVYIEGNHDFHLGEYFRKELGIETFANELVESLGGQKVHMVHGDLGNPREFGYRILRKILRLNALHQVASLVPSKWVFDLGARSSALSRNYQTWNSEKIEKTRLVYRQTAIRLFQEGYDVVVMGHTHIPDRFEYRHQGRDCKYFNTGDWVRNYTYLVFDGEQFYTKQHPVTHP